MIDVKLKLSHHDLERILQTTGDTFESIHDVKGELESLLKDDFSSDGLRKGFVDGIIGFYQENYYIRDESEIDILDIKDIHWWFRKFINSKLLHEVFQSKLEREDFKRMEDKLYIYLMSRHDELMRKNEVDRGKKIDEIDNMYEKRNQILTTTNNEETDE